MSDTDPIFERAMALQRALGGGAVLGADSLQQAARLSDHHVRLLTRMDLPCALYAESGAQVAASVDAPDHLPDPLEPTDYPAFDGERLLILHDFGRQAQRGERYMLLSLNAERFNAILHGAGIHEPLTQAEFRVLAQLLAGARLKAQAETDAVSVHTRRNQLKAVVEKLGASGQTDAVRMALLAITDRLLAAVSRETVDDAALAQMRAAYGSALRIHDLEISPGDPLRIAELGPRNGRPVLVFHPLLFPVVPLPEGVKAVEEQGLRLFVPLRRGHGLPVPRHAPTGREEMLADFADRLDEALGLLNLPPMPVMAIAFGAAWAVAFAHRHPERVERMVFVSAPNTAEMRGGRSARTHIHAIASLVDRAPWTAEAFVRLYASAVYSPSRAEQAFQATFGESPADATELAALARSGTAFEIAATTMRRAAASVANDMRVASMPWESNLASIDREMTFVHGAQDPLNPADSLRAAVEKLGAGVRFDALPDRGHLFYLRDLTPVVPAL